MKQLCVPKLHLLGLFSIDEIVHYLYPKIREQVPDHKHLKPLVKHLAGLVLEALNSGKVARMDTPTVWINYNEDWKPEA